MVMVRMIISSDAITTRIAASSKASEVMDDNAPLISRSAHHSLLETVDRVTPGLQIFSHGGIAQRSNPERACGVALRDQVGTLEPRQRQADLLPRQAGHQL